MLGVRCQYATQDHNMQNLQTIDVSAAQIVVYESRCKTLYIRLVMRAPF